MMIRRLIYICVVVMGVVGSVRANDDKITKQKSIVATLERQVAAGEREIESLRRNKAASEVKVRTLASQVEARNRLLSAQRREEVILRGEISTTDLNISKLTDEIAKERGYYSQMVREAYRSYNSHNVLTYLFTASDFYDMARKVSNVRAVAQLRAKRIDRIDSLTNTLSQERSTLLDRKLELEKVVRDLTKQREQLQRDVNSARLSISTMSAKERKALQQRELQQKRLGEAVKELQKLIRGNREGASFSTKTSNLNLPVVGGRVKQYKDNMAEIVGAAGAKVTSIYEGKIVDVKSNRITGKYDVYIAHGEYITSYGGLSQVSVSKDQIVDRGGVIGVIGASVDIITMQSEYKIVFGVYPPTTKEKMTAASCFKR